MLSSGRQAVAIVVLLLAAACSGWGCTARRLAKAERQRQEAVRALDLPRVPGPGAQPLDLRSAGSVRVLVGPGRLEVDDLSLWQAVSAEQLRSAAEQLGTLDDPWVSARVLRLDGLAFPDSALKSPGGYFVPALYDTLSGTMERYKLLRQVAAGPPEPVEPSGVDDSKPSYRRPEVLRRPLALVCASASAPFSTLARVMYTLGQAEYSDFVALAKGGQGQALTGVRIDVPRICAAPGCGGDAQGSERACSSLQLGLTAEGVALHTRRSVDGPTKVQRATPPTPADAKRLAAFRDALAASGGGLRAALGDAFGSGPGARAAGLDTSAAASGVPLPPAPDKRPTQVVPWGLKGVDAAALVRAVGQASGDLPLCSAATVAPAETQSWAHTVQTVAALRQAGVRTVYLAVLE